jgi:ferric-dicitrate binding protein FerR (iron transport regulator)
LRLDVDTRIEALTDRSLALVTGAVYVDSGGRRAPMAAGEPDGSAQGAIEIQTPAGRIREIGTQFEVRLGGATVRLRVREGLVSVDRPAGGLQVTSGRELLLDPGGGASSRELPTHGEEWAWTEAIAPRMAIEGRSLREFLDWTARERGLGLQFGRSDLATSASTIRLNGSIEGLTLDQALESVLLTCGMRHRIEGGLLIVEASGGPAL